MRPIDPQLVDEVWADIAEYPPDRVQGEGQSFLARQPHVATFAGALMRGFEPTVQTAGLGLCFLLFKVFERSLGRPFPLLSEERIHTAYEANVERLAATETGSRSLLDSFEHDGHRSLIAHILTCFYAGERPDTYYDDDVKANLFLLLKTLTEALDSSAIER